MGGRLVADIEGVGAEAEPTGGIGVLGAAETLPMGGGAITEALPAGPELDGAALGNVVLVEALPETEPDGPGAATHWFAWQVLPAAQEPTASHVQPTSPAVQDVDGSGLSEQVTAANSENRQTLN